MCSWTTDMTVIVFYWTAASIPNSINILISSWVEHDPCRFKLNFELELPWRHSSLICDLSLENGSYKTLKTVTNVHCICSLEIQFWPWTLRNTFQSNSRSIDRLQSCQVTLIFLKALKGFKSDILCWQLFTWDMYIWTMFVVLTSEKNI